VITHVGQFAEERFFTGAECAFDELDKEIRKLNLKKKDHTNL
jgi:ribosome-associated translation inhibitor RaiA